ncbi:MAG TPA: response regulator [Thermoguttaceae bacterium]|nr:response regulator [Thermoguttaceae bacterium]
MPSVLVVDDLPADRHLVAEYLKDDAFELRFAANGAEALEKLEQGIPDLVVTDLMMPEVDGLELVRACRSRYPLVPVILMTSQGTEETVVQALKQGAASYVPKHAFPRRLLSTVRNVLAVSGRRRVHTRLMECMDWTECAFALKNNSALIHPLITYLQERTSDLDVCDESDRTRIGVALEEALANALYHGNLEVGSELRGEDDKGYHALIVERLNTSPYRDRKIHVETTMSREHATFVVRDEGTGFDPSSLPDPTDPANLEKASGRGLLLMRTFMDEVAYNGEGNAVVLTKRRRPDAASKPQ